MFVVAAERCRGCLVCSRVCPSGALSIKGYTASIDQDKCQGCGHCLAACPFGAIYQVEEGTAPWAAAGTQRSVGKTTDPQRGNEATATGGSAKGKGNAPPPQTPLGNPKPLPRHAGTEGDAWRPGPGYWPEEAGFPFRAGRGSGQGLGPGLGHGPGRGAGRGMGRGLGQGMGRRRQGG